MSEHDDTVRLRHMLEYACEVSEFIEGKTRADLDSDVILDRALRYSIGIVGEAATHLSDEFCALHSDMPWSEHYWNAQFLVSRVSSSRAGHSVAHCH
jgi:uncharacterized protein with HEPN domain